MSFPAEYARRAALLLIGVPVLLALATPSVSAHPLGNFTVNRYDGLSIHPDRVDDLAVVDTAEIPTLQGMPALDTDHNGRLSPAEAATHATTACTTVAQGISASAAPHSAGSAPRAALRFHVLSHTYRLVRGQAGLDTGRLECHLTAPAKLEASGVVELATGVDPARIGWHEITVKGDGVRIGSSDVPAHSASNELRKYPADLLSNPPDVRHAHVTLGSGPGADPARLSGTGMLGSWYAALDAHLGSLTEQDRLTLPIGLLAVLLALVLGAGHAALPGHGKTIMAAYLAGRQGRPRDAVTVATTVTFTHTGSVLALGTALSVSSALVGEQALAWLGTISGLLITAAGIWLLPAALRNLRAHRQRDHAHHDHTHDRGHHAHTRAHSQDDPSDPGGEHVAADHLVAVHAGHPTNLETTTAADATKPHSLTAQHEHPDSQQPSDDGHSPHVRHDHAHVDHRHGGHDHSHGLFGHHHHGDNARHNKGGLIGIGIAGGLVPSPSALVVLLGSIALGRTAFGVVLVVCYGIGMAATLAAAGLLLLKLRDRIPALNGERASRLATWGARITPLGTALLILAVGVGTALRAMPL
ncbi:nickel transporter [Streptomyces fildesensis]|uniref:HoxN/HupN/NixA family nickel/cobalt transporter n=1 Tax=Streptomyces fildesensis TaxID=375757 RepID=UPI00360CA232